MMVALDEEVVRSASIWGRSSGQIQQVGCSVQGGARGVENDP